MNDAAGFGKAAEATERGPQSANLYLTRMVQCVVWDHSHGGRGGSMRRTSICTRSVVEGGGVGFAGPGVNRQLCHPGCLASQTVRNMSILSAL